MRASSAAQDPQPTEGVSAIAQAFDQHPIVALGEIHGSRAEHAFIRRLLSQPWFTRTIGNVVVEFGNARYQRIADDYVSGRPVSLERLRLVWTQTTQRDTHVWDAPVYQAFFRSVRQINRHLGSRKIRVLLGDPRIDWQRIRGDCHDSDKDWRQPRCLDYWLQRRDSVFASVVRREILTRGRKALLIAGGAHFEHAPPPSHGSADDTVSLIDPAHPGLVFVVTPYLGFPAAPDIEERITRWPRGSIALLRGTLLGTMTLKQLYGPPPPPLPGNVANPEAEAESHQQFGLRYDALLYLGPSG